MIRKKGKFRSGLNHPLDKPIVLIGLMGAGKTTVGRRLSARLGVDFIDTDSEIEAAAGRTISDIFEEFGEEEFRDGERRVIARLLTETPKILATGGGAYMDPETRVKIKEAAYSIWLKADVELLVERVGRRNTRPLLKTGNPAEILTRLSKERGQIYAEADLTVESGAGPHEKVVDRIITALNEFRSSSKKDQTSSQTESA